MTLLSIVIPVYNSEHTIAPLVHNVHSVLGHLAFEIVLVNDGSRDASERVCSELAMQYPSVKFISLRRNFGEFNAVMCGLNHASGSYCAIIDDDFQNPPSEILVLLEAAQRHGYDVVYSYYEQKQHSWFRNLGSRLVNQMTTWLLDKPHDLYLSSFKLIQGEVVREIVGYQGPYPYIDGLIFRVTRHIGKAQVSHLPRKEGRSNYTLSKLISLFLNILFCYSPRPLRLLTVSGLFVFAVGILLLIMDLAGSMRAQQDSGTDLLMLSVYLLVASIQLLGMGMIGEYLGKLFMSQSGLPQYIIRFKKNI